MQKDAVRDRTRDLAHYIIDNLSGTPLEKTKLCKMMWFADLLHFRRHGATISGQSSYVRMSRGPVPNDMTEVLDEMINSQTIFGRDGILPNGSVRLEFFSLTSANHDSFDSSEVRAIQQAMTTIAPLTPEQASASTHDAYWDSLNDGDEMLIEAAAVIPREVMPDDLAFMAEQSKRFEDVHCKAGDRI